MGHSRPVLDRELEQADTSFPMSRGRYNPYVEQERQRAAEARRIAAEIRARDVQERRNERLRQQAHLHGRTAEVDEANREIADRLNSLHSLLALGVAEAEPITFDSLKTAAVLPHFNAQGQDQPAPEPQWSAYEPKPQKLVERLLPGSSDRQRARIEAAKEAFAAKYAEWADYEQSRNAWLVAAHAAHQVACDTVSSHAQTQHEEVDAFEAAYQADDADAIQQYFSIVLERDSLPEGFPHIARVAYLKESRQLVVERELPTVDIVPTVTSNRYIKTTDAITSSTRPALQIRELYVTTVAQLALRTLHLLFTADTGGDVDSIVLNCFVDTTSPETGQRITPCLLTVRTSRDVLASHDLTMVDPSACLKHLNAEVSAKPHELKAVRPIVNFNMVDHRFVDKTDILAGLDQRPNIAELTPAQFEGLITNLFEKMGLETRLTQASRDGGVDCVAWDMRPVVGGKVIVQAKRYKHTVGVSAVRDLYGTVLNEGAAKGILVTTSGYGTSSFEFAQNKPLQLLAGGELLYLLEQHAGIKARIEFPQEWIDPVPDMIEEGVPAISIKPPADSMSVPARGPGPLRG
jgi:restriction system protein